VRAEGPGPQVLGETVSFTLQLAGGRHIIAGRLLGPDGSPQSHRWVEMGFEQSSSDGSLVERTTKFHTDHEGRFRTTIVSDRRPLVLENTLLCADGTDSPASQAHLGSLRASLKGVLDLGDVRLELLPLVAAGRVVDSSGRGIYWTTVRTYMKVNRWGRPYSPEDGEEHQWFVVNPLQVQTNKEGKFEIRGEVEPGEYVLIASEEKHLDSDRVAFVPGDEEVEIVLHQDGAVAGSILLDEGVPPSWFEVEVELIAGLVLEPGLLGGGQPPQSRVRDDASFQLAGLPAGPSRFHLRPWGNEQSLITVDDVLIAPGGVTRDQRLQQIDLRGLVRQIEVEVIGAMGSGPPDGHVAILEGDDGESPPRHLVLRDGHASFITTRPAVDLEVHAVGYLTAALENVRDDASITMQPGIPVHIRLPEGINPPNHPMELRVRLAPTFLGDRPHEEYLYSGDGRSRTQWGSWSRGHAPSLNPNGETTLFLPAPGSYEVLWQVATPSNRGGGWIRSPRDQGLIEIGDSSFGATLMVGPEPKGYALAKGRLGQSP